MPKPTEPAAIKQAVFETTHEPTEDATGALRPDRAFTPAEAQAIDQANAEHNAELRRARFATAGGRRR